MQSIHTPDHKQQLAASCPRVTNDSASKSTPLLTELGRPVSFLHRHSQFASDLFNATMRINLEPSKMSSRLNCPGRWAILMGRGGRGTEATKHAGAGGEPRTRGPCSEVASASAACTWFMRAAVAQQHGECAVAHVHAQKAVLVAGRKLRSTVSSSGGAVTDEYSR